MGWPDGYGLAGRYRSVELVEQNGKKASVYRKTKQENGSQFDFLYLRKDILDRYLRKTFVWVIWGGRQFQHDDYVSLRMKPEMIDVFEKHENIYKNVMWY